MIKNDFELHVGLYVCVSAFPIETESQGIGVPVTRVTGSSGLPDMGAGNQTQVFYKSSKVLLTAKPSLQACALYFYQTTHACVLTHTHTHTHTTYAAYFHAHMQAHTHNAFPHTHHTHIPMHTYKHTHIQVHMHALFTRTHAYTYT